MNADERAILDVLSDAQWVSIEDIVKMLGDSSNVFAVYTVAHLWLLYKRGLVEVREAQKLGEVRMFRKVKSE